MCRREGVITLVERTILSGPLRLPGEPEDSHELEDVLHWSKVYRELLAGFRELAGIEAITRRRKRLKQISQLESRLLFWDRRCRELSEPSVKLSPSR